jgi:hypothetical protein
LKISGTEQLKRDIDKLMADANIEKRSIVDNVVKNLKAATPVDTGFARDSWKVSEGGIVNDAAYIAELNAGTSKQAPAYFVERTILTTPGVLPKGTIVTYR